MSELDIDLLNTQSPTRRVPTKDEQAESAKREDVLKREQRERAAVELAHWNEQRSKNLSNIREAHRMHAPIPTAEHTGSVWEKVSYIVDALPSTTGGKDLGKFRSLLLSLKTSPPVAF
jgi:hypothetical protein